MCSWEPRRPPNTHLTEAQMRADRWGVSTSTGRYHFHPGDRRLAGAQLALDTRYQVLDCGAVEGVIDVHPCDDQDLVRTREQGDEVADRHHPGPSGDEGADALLACRRDLLAHEKGAGALGQEHR